MHHIKYFHSSMHSPYENKYIIYITHIALITKISQVISLPLSQLVSPFPSQTQGCILEALNISLPLKLSSLSSLSFNHISPPLSSIAKKGHTKHKGCLRFKLSTNLSPFVLNSPPLSWRGSYYLSLPLCHLKEVVLVTCLQFKIDQVHGFTSS